MPRLLVVEGNTRKARLEQVAAGGIALSEGYAELLQRLLPGAVVDICYPADPGANLPIGGLESYDGAAITGSALNVYDGGPEIARQIELTREILRARTPLFGSCWGLQLMTVAAGGVVRANPKGREIGIGRRITLTPAGRDHPMYRDKGSTFDAITVHLVLGPRSRGLIGAADFARMKKGAIFVNTSRGPIVDEAALVAALREGRIFAALDVYDTEPLPSDNPFRNLPNTVLTPHLGFTTVEGLGVFYEHAIDNILAFLDGKPKNMANPDALKHA